MLALRFVPRGMSCSRLGVFGQSSSDTSMMLLSESVMLSEWSSRPAVSSKGMFSKTPSFSMSQGGDDGRYMQHQHQCHQNKSKRPTKGAPTRSSKASPTAALVL